MMPGTTSQKTYCVLIKMKFLFKHFTNWILWWKINQEIKLSLFSETCSKMTVCHRKSGNQTSVREALPRHKLGLINQMPCHKTFKFMCQTGCSRQACLSTVVKTCLCLKSTGDVRILSNLTAKNVTHLQKRSIWLPAPNSDNILSLFQFCAKFSNSTTFSLNILFTLWKDVNQYPCQNVSFWRKFSPGKGDCLKKSF